MTDTEMLAHVEKSCRCLVATVEIERIAHAERRAEVKLLRARVETYERANKELLAQIANLA